MNDTVRQLDQRRGVLRPAWSELRAGLCVKADELSASERLQRRADLVWGRRHDHIAGVAARGQQLHRRLGGEERAPPVAGGADTGVEDRTEQVAVVKEIWEFTAFKWCGR